MSKWAVGMALQPTTSERRALDDGGHMEISAFIFHQYRLRAFFLCADIEVLTKMPGGKIIVRTDESEAVIESMFPNQRITKNYIHSSCLSS